MFLGAKKQVTNTREPSAIGGYSSIAKGRGEMSEEAESLMRSIAEAYVKRGFPARETWWVDLDDADPVVVRELMNGHRLIEPMGGRHKLTPAGHAWVMANQS